MPGAFRDLIEGKTIPGLLLLAGITIVGIQLVLLLLGLVIPSLADVRLGFIFNMLLVAGFVYFLFKVITRTDKLDRPALLYLLLVVGIITGFFFLSKTFAPQLFSLSMPDQFEDSANQILDGKFEMQSILGASSDRFAAGCACSGYSSCKAAADKETCEAASCTWDCGSSLI